MSSGRGGGGSRPSKNTNQPAASGGGVRLGQPVDPCNLDFVASLTSANPTAVAKIHLNDELSVVLHAGAFLVAVCRIPATAEVVGSIAGVPQLNDLIGCLQQGVAYSARVILATPTRVDVRVRRAAS